MTSAFKGFFRDMVPMSYQVPLKYAYNSVRGMLEPELSILDQLVAPGDHVIDVGANRGIYAYKLWRLGARLDLFEPNPACALVLSAWAKGRAGVAVHAVALSDKQGIAQLNIPVDASGVQHDASASIEPVGHGKTRSESVTLATLDSFSFQDVALVKIDVEGHERSVIAGAVATLEKARPALLIEIEKRHTGHSVLETAKIIEDMRYRAFFLEENAIRSIKEFDAAASQNKGSHSKRSEYINNFIFVAEEKMHLPRYRRFLGAAG